MAKKKKLIKCFLGGTKNSNWREELIPQLNIEYFNPIVKEQTPESQKEEIKQRKSCDYCLYVITPKLDGLYSIAEVIDDSNKKPEKTIFCYLERDGYLSLKEDVVKSLDAIGEMVKKNGGIWLKSLREVANFLNK